MSDIDDKFVRAKSGPNSQDEKSKRSDNYQRINTDNDIKFQDTKEVADLSNNNTNNDYEEQQDPETKLKNRPVKAIIFAMLFALTFVIYMAVAKYTISTGVSVLDLAFFRVTILFLSSSVMCYLQKSSMSIPMQFRCKLFLRSFLGVIGYTCYISGVKLLPLVIATVLFNTAPFWTSIWSYIMLGEKLQLFEIISLVFCFGAVVLMCTAKPPEQDGTTSYEQNLPADGNNLSTLTSMQIKIVGCLFILINSFTYSVVGVLTRQMQELNYSVIIFYYGAYSVVVLFLVITVQVLITNKPYGFSTYSWEQYGWLLLVSLFNTLSMNFQTIAQQNENPAFISLIGYSGIVYAFIGDALIFQLGYSTLELVGAIIIITLTISIIRFKLKRTKKTQKQQVQETNQDSKLSEKQHNDYKQA